MSPYIRIKIRVQRIQKALLSFICGLLDIVAEEGIIETFAEFVVNVDVSTVLTVLVGKGELVVFESHSQHWVLYFSVLRLQVRYSGQEVDAGATRQRSENSS